MRNLINFLLKNSSWFLFIFLEIFCFYLIFSGNSYQKSVFLNSTNEVTGRVYSVSGGILSYFGLKQENQELLQQNAKYQEQISKLKEYVLTLESDTLKVDAFLSSLDKKTESRFILAAVEKNSISMIENYIVINKGENDGIKADMGVISQQGIVGIVRASSSNYSIIQSVLNSHSRFSCKVVNSTADGILLWEGGDSRYAKLTEYPKYGAVEIGDTIVTTGFSDFFPEGIIVGTIEDFESEADDNFYSMKIRLSTDFGALKNVFVLRNNNDEIKELEEKVKGDAKK